MLTPLFPCRGPRLESYPPGPITNYGIQLLEEGIEPNITYTSPEGDLAFYLNGGLAPWVGVTEGVILAEGMDGLHPIFTHLDHKGARQDGATWADTVYEPAEMTMRVTLTARTPEGFRKLVRQWFASWDPQKQGRLSWVTPEGGEWWCHPRLFRTPPEKLERGYSRVCSQTFTWTIRNDDAFWRSYDSVSTFGYVYADGLDTFNRDDVSTLGPNWSQTYSGAGAGVCETEPALGVNLWGRARWTPSGTTARTVVNTFLGTNEIQTVTIDGTPTGGSFKLTFSGQQTANIAYNANAAAVQTALENLSNIAPGDVVVGGGPGPGTPYTVTFQGVYAKINVGTMTATHTLTGGTNPVAKVGTTTQGMGPSTATDNQVIIARMGDFFTWPFPTGAAVDIWGRLNTAGTTGIRARISPTSVTLSRFNAGVETVMFTRSLLLPPLWWETWTLQCGTATDPRRFRILRSEFPVVDFKETGTGSALGGSQRGGGFGMAAGAGSPSQNTPPTVDEWSMGDNLTVAQVGQLNLTNIGDQEAWPDLIVYGPGTFKFGNGPDTPATIEFGPLLTGQVALIKTAPGERGVYDITHDASTQQDLTEFQDFIQRLISLAFNNNIPPLLDWFASLFGIRPPQGNMYSLLRGRWTRSIPPRPVADSPTTSSIAIEVTGGNADTKVIAALTPRRRWPE